MKREVGAAQAKGFTIIEVMLFLAISGSLVVALMVTVGSTITRQRFSDSINTTQAYMQTQVNETLNVVNSRAAASCSTSAGSTVLSGGTTARGASNCVVLGRAIYFTVGSSHVTSYPVVGHEPTAASAASGADLISLYKPVVDTTNGEGYDIAWSEAVASVHPAGASKILLLRSPDSGSVLTFGGESVPTALAAGTRNVNVCFKTNDLANSRALIALSTVSGAEGITTKFDIPTEQQADLC